MQTGDEMDAMTTDNMQEKLLSALEKNDIRNEKGRKAAANLIMKPESIHIIADAIKASSGDRKQFTAGLLALVKLYDSGASVAIRALCTQAATDGLTVNMLETRIIPLLVELGIILKLGEKSYQWQAFDKIGTKAGLLDNFKAMLEVTPEKLALRAAQDRATDEARLLTITKKQAAIANNRKATALQAVNASQEAERIAATLPKGNPGAAGWITQNPGIAISLALVLVVVVGGKMTNDNTGSNTVQLASMPTTMGTSK